MTIQQQEPVVEPQYPPTVGQPLQQPKKKRSRAVIAIAAAASFVIGFGAAWTIRSLQTIPVIEDQQTQIEKLNTSLDSVKQQLADAQAQSDPDSDTSDEASDDSVKGLNNTATNGNIEMKVLEAGEQSTISYDTCGDGCANGEYGPKSPDANTKYWVVKVEVKNNTSGPLDITCSYPYEIFAVNSDGQQYTPIDDLYKIEGNPECNAGLQPGLTATVTYPFQTPLDAKMVGIGFRDVGDWTSSNPGEENPTYIVTEEGYTIS